MRSISDVLDDIKQTEQQLESLRQELAALTATATATVTATTAASAVSSPPESQSTTRTGTKVSTSQGSASSATWPLPAQDYQRYGRQIILPEIGLQGQLRIRSAAVLVVGLGGLGCPAARYLAGAGIGRLGLLDGDVVEVSNLHRQILHTTTRVGMPKVVSAARSLVESNDSITIEPYAFHLTPQNALELFAKYDLILDCTDHPTSRYLISDAAVLTGKPLVSASALKTDGQLIVLNNPPRRLNGDLSTTNGDIDISKSMSGPCYRCIFPKPPPPDSIVSCGEGGILGPVVGAMGVLQALEALKIIATGSPESAAESASMLIFSAFSTPPFRSLRMRPRRSNCAACGDQPEITADSLTSGSLDYVAFCGATNPVKVLQTKDRLAPKEVHERLLRAQSAGSAPPLTLIDTRDKVQYELGHIEGSINIPFKLFSSGQIPRWAVHSLPSSLTPGQDDPQMTDTAAAVPGPVILDDGTPLVFVCRLGNDSQLAAQQLKDLGYAGVGEEVESGGEGEGEGEGEVKDEDGSGNKTRNNNRGRRWIGDLDGGLRAWRRDVQPDFPDF